MLGWTGGLQDMLDYQRELEVKHPEATGRRHWRWRSGKDKLGP